MKIIRQHFKIISLAIIGTIILLSVVKLLGEIIEEESRQNLVEATNVQMQSQKICLGLRISVPINWQVHEIKNPTPGPLEGISYEASINKHSFKIFNESNKIQLDIVCYQPIKVDETTGQLKEQISAEEAVEILRPTKELADFRSVNFDITFLDQKQCSHFGQMALPYVICKLPFGIGCGKAPQGVKVKDLFICPQRGDKSTGALIYEITQYHQLDARAEELLDKVFNSVTF